jgi:antitoxin component of MazEF toxin-antitoxin module
MSLVIKRSDERSISIPPRLMAELHLREGDEVKAIIEGDTLRLERLDKFLSLRGALADDDAFDRAMEQIDRAWQSWTAPASA